MSNKLGRIGQLTDPPNSDEDILETWTDYVPAALLFWILVVMGFIVAFAVPAVAYGRSQP